MKTYRLLIIAFVLIVSSCYDEETLTPSSSGEQSERFIFPQGNGPGDEKLKTIYEKFGVKVVYKDFRNEDFNLSWTNPAIGKVGFDIGSNEYSDIADFMSDHFFKFLTPQITKQVLPPYFYVADSIYQTNIYATGESKVATTYFYDGLDFWIFTWNGCQAWSINNGKVTSLPKPVARPRTSFEYFYRSRIMLKEVFRDAVKKGKITIPEDFNTGFDFTTAIETAAAKESDPNYYKKRGFPGQFNNKLNFNVTILGAVTSTNPQQNFIDYMLLCMRYTPDSIQVLYPISKFPLIHQKYPLVINHIKDKYGINLNEIAKKPTL